MPSAVAMPSAVTVTATVSVGDGAVGHRAVGRGRVVVIVVRIKFRHVEEGRNLVVIVVMMVVSVPVAIFLGRGGPSVPMTCDPRGVILRQVHSQLDVSSS